MLKVTNTQGGPRGLNATNGPVFVEPGHSVSVAVFLREKQPLETSGWFSVTGDYEPNPGTTDAPGYANAASDLLAKADSLHFKTFEKQAREILGDDLPDTKAEIIAALEAKASE